MVTKPRVTERYEHDDCPECGTPSVPFEGVPDQTLRGCPNCLHEWWEDLDRPPVRASRTNQTQGSRS